jgi:hypothetical protein
MKDYTNIVKTAVNREELEAVLSQYNDDKKNGIEVALKLATFEETLKSINGKIKEEYHNAFCALLERQGRKVAFSALVLVPSYERLTYTIDGNGLITIHGKEYTTKNGKQPNYVSVDLAKLEKAYQVYKSTDSKNGKPIPNTDVTIYEESLVKDCATHIYNNLLKLYGTEFFEDYKMYVPKITIGKSNILEEKEAKAFEECSKTQINMQFKALMKFFNLDLTIAKADQFPIYQQLFKMRKDKKSNTKEWETISSETFLNVIFSEMCRVAQGKTLTINTKTADGYKNILETKTEPIPTESTTETAQLEAPKAETEKVGGITKVKTETKEA